MTELWKVVPFSLKEKLEYPILFLANIQPSLQMNIIKQVHNPSLIVLDTMNLWINISRESLINVLSNSNILLLSESEATL